MVEAKNDVGVEENKDAINAQLLGISAREPMRQE